MIVYEFFISFLALMIEKRAGFTRGVKATPLGMISNMITDNPPLDHGYWPGTMESEEKHTPAPRKRPI